MKRFLWLMCIGGCTATFAVACGDDDGGGDGQGMEDGGVTIDEQIDNLNTQLTGLEGELGDLEGTVTDGLADLNTKLDGLTDSVGTNGDDITSLQGQLEDLITPDACSAEEICVPDGVAVTAGAMLSLMTALCEKEFDCCSEEERAVRLGAGVEEVEDCVNQMVDMLENGQTPDIDLFWDVSDVIGEAVQIAIAINSNDVQVGIDADAILECEAQVQDIECNGEGEEGEAEEFCEPEDYEEEIDPCSAEAIVIGLQQEGELCGVTGIDECAAGLVCRHEYGGGEEYAGFCMPPSAVGDACSEDWHCDGQDQECDHDSNTCQQLGDEGDDCEYLDEDFLIANESLDPSMGDGWLQNLGATRHGCKPGLSCDPIEQVCVNNCSEHTLCWGNWQCPEDTICNFTEVENLWETWGLGICTEPIEEGEPCSWQEPLGNGELLGLECETERCNDVGDGPECVDKLSEPGDDCGEDVEPQTADPTCATNHCNLDGECADLCNVQADCPDGFFCNWYGTQPLSIYDDGRYACEPKGGNGDDCDQMVDEGGVEHPLGTDVTCESGRCASGDPNQCAAKADAGDPCDHHADCDDDHFCGYDTTDMREECMPFVATAGDCATPAAGDWGCGPNARCIEGACRDEGDEGDDCSNGYGCRGNPAMTCAGLINECWYGGDFPEGADCDTCAVDEDGIGHCTNDVCADGWCGPAFTCLTPIEEDEDCDADDPTANRCEDGFYCKHDPDAEGDDIGKGKCEPQRGVGDSCEPRYDQYGDGDGGNDNDGDDVQLNVHDCLGEDDTYYLSNNCLLIGNDFVCGQNAYEDGIMCDGED